MAKKEQKAMAGAASGASTGAAFGPWGAAIGGVLGGLGGLAGGDDKDGSEELAKNQALWAALTAPTADDLAVNYNRYDYAGDIANREDEAQQLSMTDNLENVNLDPRLAQAKTSALETLQKIASGGFTANELNDLQNQRSSSEADLTSKLKQLQQNQDMRGVGNSDMALAQRMMAAQGAANSSGQAARDMQAQGLKRSLDAISQGGVLANQYENTDYARQADLANAKNTRELNNLSQRANVSNSNVDRFNNALQYNNTNRQANLNNNTNMQHSQQNANANAKNTAFGNQVTKLGGMTNSNVNFANNQIQNQARDNAMTAGVFDGISKGAAAYIANNPDDKKKKPVT